MPYRQIGNLNMYYEQYGDGTPIIFLHSGFNFGTGAFDAQIEHFSRSYHIYLPDFRGHGRSRCSDLTWNSDMLAEDIVAFMDAEGIEKAHLIGYSTGGGVAYYIASRTPERVLSVISIGNGGVIYDEGSEDYLPENLLKNGETDFIEDMKSRHADAHGGNWEEYMRQEVWDWKNHPHLTHTEWENIRCPMLLIAGEKDIFATRERLKAIKSKCPQAEICIIDGAGHGPHFQSEKADEVNELMIDFLKKNEKNYSIIGKKVRVTVDRPLGSQHPNHPDTVYELNYGYVDGVIAPDGEEQDVYILGVDEPITEFDGVVVAVIKRLDDVEEKWVVSDGKTDCTKEEIARRVSFMEKHFNTEIVT